MSNLSPEIEMTKGNLTLIVDDCYMHTDPGSNVEQFCKDAGEAIGGGRWAQAFLSMEQAHKLDPMVIRASVLIRIKHMVRFLRYSDDAMEVI